MNKRAIAMMSTLVGSVAMAACAFGGAADASRGFPPAGTPVAATPAASTPGGKPNSGTLPGGGRPTTLTPDDTVTFCEPVDGVELLMDIYYPAGHTTDSNDPAIVYVHGGGWTTGSRNEGEGARYIPALVSQGYVVFAVDYRLAPEYEFPAQIEDVQCALRNIRANAATYGIDADRIGAIGGSAGGQLVNVLGTAEEGDFDEVGGYERYSSEVTAVVDMYGASDFSDPNMSDHNAAHVQVFGTDTYEDEESNTLWMASAVNYVDSGDAAFLLLHGEEDPVVPISQSEIFYSALEDAGIDATFVRVENAGHAFVPTGGTPNPGANELTTYIIEFFHSHL
ncbi:MAG: alpha/beta hydrolase fold domain-containing protein [Dehalococcoidia bacterium]